MASSSVIKAVIIVGGPSRGTRFRPLSLNHEKPLFPIAGLPMVQHQVSAMSKLAGMREILLIGFYEPVLFQSFIDEMNAELPNISIRYLREYQSLGTGGGLYHFRDQIMRGNPTLFFVLHADICSTFHLQAMLQFHMESGGTCTILGTKVPKNASTKYGCLVSDPKTSRVLHYVEKPETFVSDLISCGIYCFGTAVFKDMERTINARQEAVADSTDQTWNESNVDSLRMEHDILRPLAEANSLFVFETSDFWRQIKTAGSAVPANKLYLGFYRQHYPNRLAPCSPASEENDTKRKQPFILGDVFIHPTATIHPLAKLGPNVSIGPRVVIGQGVRIKESIILDNVEIQEFSCVIYAIVGWGSQLGQWCRVEGTPEYASNASISPASNLATDLLGSVPNVMTSDLMLPNGLKNQSVTILGDNVKVANESVIRNCIVLPQKILKHSFTNEILM